MTGESGWSPFERLISQNARQVDQDALIKQAHEVVRRLELDRSRVNEELRFERLWRLKASGMTKEGKRGPIVLSRVVAAYRRYLAGLPVWGRASVFTKLATEGQVDSFGLDWRPVREAPVAQAYVLDPDEGAKRVLEELQTTLPNGRFTLEDFDPEFFALGYFSFPRRQRQTVMQPVWVAMLRSRGWTSLNHLIVVPAASTPYEPILRIPQRPPLDAGKRSPGAP
jgi:hypothetical protein